MPEFLKPEEVVARYKGNISTKTLANWRTKGGGPAYVKIGGKVMYHIAAVETWEESRVYSSASARLEVTDEMRQLAKALYG